MNRVSKDVSKEVLDIYVYKISVFWKLKIRSTLFSLFSSTKNTSLIVKKKNIFISIFFYFMTFFVMDEKERKRIDAYMQQMKYLSHTWETLHLRAADGTVYHAPTSVTRIRGKTLTSIVDGAFVITCWKKHIGTVYKIHFR